MKCQILFSRKKILENISLSAVEFDHSIVRIDYQYPSNIVKMFELVMQM